MRVFEVISLMCLIHVASSFDELYRIINPSAKILNIHGVGDYSQVYDKAAIGWNSFIGQFSHIGTSVQIGTSCSIGNYCRIDFNAMISDNVQIYDNANIDFGVTIGKDSQIMSYVQVGPNVKIGNHCQVNGYTAISSNTQIGEFTQIMNNVKLSTLVKIGTNNFLNQFTTVWDDVEIGNKCILDMFATVNRKSIIKPNVYIGEFVKIGTNGRIGENSIIYRYATVPDYGKVERDDVIIKTPTSSDLYMDCLPYELIPHMNVQRMANRLASGFASDKFNNDLRNMIKMQFDQLKRQCESVRSADFQILSLIKSLYLIEYHGIDSFKRNRELTVGNYHGFDNPLLREDHFVEGSPRNIVDVDVRNQMVLLLALEQDARRGYRSDVTFCKMLDEIITGQRKVKCDQEILPSKIE